MIEIPVLIVEVEMFLPHDDGASVDWSLALQDSFLPNNNFPPGLLLHKRIIHDVIQDHISREVSPCSHSPALAPRLSGIEQLLQNSLNPLLKPSCIPLEQPSYSGAPYCMKRKLAWLRKALYRPTLYWTKE